MMMRPGDSHLGVGESPDAEASATPRRLRAFLSHSSTDKKRVRKLYSRLGKDGFDPWLDEKNLLGGQNWRQTIIDAVRASDVVVVCLTRESISKPGFVHVEINRALDVAEEQPDCTIFIIPLRLEECETPPRLKHLQCVDYFAPDGYERLTKSLRQRAEELNRQPPRQPSSRKPWVFGSVLLSLLAALFVVLMLTSSGGPPPSAPLGAASGSTSPPSTPEPSDSAAEIRDRPKATPTPRPTVHIYNLNEVP